METQNALATHDAYTAHETQMTTAGLVNPPQTEVEPSSDVVISKSYVVPPGLRLFRGKLLPFPTGNSLYDNTVHVPDLSTLQVVHVATTEEGSPSGSVRKVRKVLPSDVKPLKLGRYSAEEFAALSSPPKAAGETKNGNAPAVPKEKGKSTLEGRDPANASGEGKDAPSQGKTGGSESEAKGK